MQSIQACIRIQLLSLDRYVLQSLLADMGLTFMLPGRQLVLLQLFLM